MQLVSELDTETTRQNALVCLPSIYDDPAFYTRLGITQDDWEEFETPYTKKVSNGLVYASAVTPVDIISGKYHYKKGEIVISHDCLTHDLYNRVLKENLKFMEAAFVSGLHEGHHSYLERIIGHILGKEDRYLPGRDFISEGFANYREDKKKCQRPIAYGYNELMDKLFKGNFLDLNYVAAPKLVGTLHDLVSEQNKEAYSDMRKRYVYMEKKALLAALYVRDASFPKEKLTFQFIKRWMSELGLEEDVVREKFNSYNSYVTS